MEMANSNDANFQKVSDWFPLILIFGGYLLARIGLDSYAATMNLGFFSYGLLGTILYVWRGYHSQISLRFFKVVVQVLIMILAVINVFLTGTFIFLMALILLDKLVLTSNRLAVKPIK
jgi:hypothetical protein